MLTLSPPYRCSSGIAVQWQFRILTVCKNFIQLLKGKDLPLFFTTELVKQFS